MSREYTLSPEREREINGKTTSGREYTLSPDREMEIQIEAIGANAGVSTSASAPKKASGKTTTSSNTVTTTSTGTATTSDNLPPVRTATVSDNLKSLGSNFLTGLSSVGADITKTVDWLVPDEAVSELLGVENKVGQIFDLTVAGHEAREKYNKELGQKAAKEIEEIGNFVVRPVAEALPSAVLAMMSYGSSLAGTAGTLGMQTAASTGIIGAIKQVLSSQLKNPNFLLTFAQTAGETYDKAKANGASELEAQAATLATSYGIATLENMGGIQNVPGSKGNIFGTLLKSAFDEGIEEPIQGAFTGVVEKAIYDHEKEWLSLTDPDAVFSGTRAVQEFLGGVTVGGILGGGMTAVQGMQNLSNTYRIGQEFLQGRNKNTIDTAIQIGFSNAPGTAAYRAAEAISAKVKAGENVSAYAVGKMVQESFTPKAKKARSIYDKTMASAQAMGVDVEAASPLAQVGARLGVDIELVSPEALTINKNTATVGSGGQYSIGTFPNGTRYINVDVDQSLFDGLTDKEKLKMAELVIRERFVGKVIGNQEHPAYVGKTTAKEYAHPAKPLRDTAIIDAKARVSTELDDLLKVATDWNNTQDGEGGHYHPEAVGGFDHATVLFKVGDSLYSGIANVEIIEQGRLLKDITKIEKATEGDYGSYETSSQPVSHDGFSNTNVSQNSIGVNSQFMQDSGEYASEGTVADGRYIPATYTVNEQGQRVVATPARILLNADLAKRNTQAVLNFVLKHELTHSIEGTAAWDTLVRTVRRSMGEENWNAAVAEVQAERRTVGDTAGATNPEAEVIANWVGFNLYKADFVRTMASSNTKAAGRIVSVLDRMRLALGGEGKNLHARQIAALERVFLKALESGQNAFLTDNAKNSLHRDGDSAIISAEAATDSLTYAEEDALLAYKSGGSYTINAKLLSGESLSPYEQAVVEGLDGALTKLPIYRGTVYRNIIFDGFGDRAAVDAFLEEYVVGRKVMHPSYTSTSTDLNGYPVEGRYIVHYKIQSATGRDMQGYGNNAESEVLIPRNAVFLVDDIRYDRAGTPTIYLTEMENDEQSVNTGRSGKGVGKPRTYAGGGRADISGNVSERPDLRLWETSAGNMQQMQTFDTSLDELRSVPGQNTESYIGQRRVRGVRADNGQVNMETEESSSSVSHDIEAGFSDARNAILSPERKAQLERDALEYERQHPADPSASLEMTAEERAGITAEAGAGRQVAASIPYVSSQVQTKQVVTANDMDGIVAELGDAEAYRRMYSASVFDRPTGTVEVDGQEMDADDYMAAVYRQLPDGEAALQQIFRQTENQLKQELQQSYVQGDLDTPARLKIDLQLFAVKAKLDYVLNKGEEGTKTRRFFENRLKGMDANQAHQQELLDYLAGRSETYNPISNKKTLERAKDKLRDPKYNDKLQRRLRQYNPNDRFSATDVAAATVLINDARNAGDLELYADLVQGLSRKGTELGRAVQAFSMQARMTPEGTLRAAQRTFHQAVDTVAGKGASDSLDNLSDIIVDAVDRAAGEKARGVKGYSDSKGDEAPVFRPLTEEERYELLKARRIVPAEDKSETIDGFSAEELSHRVKSKAEKVIYPLAKKLGILNQELSTPELDISFELTKGNGLKSSLSHQLQYGGDYADFTKALINLEEILQNAVLIEQHTDKYIGTVRENADLLNVSVLLGLYKSGTQVIPVQFEIKQYKNRGNRLYLTVALTKIEADVLGGGRDVINRPLHNLVSASDYSLADVFKNINPQDRQFLKYIPDGFLSDAQKQAKKEAVLQEKLRIASYARKSETAAVEDISGFVQEYDPYISAKEIKRILEKAFKEAKDMPAHLKKMLQSDQAIADLAERIAAIHRNGHLNADATRRAFEEALGLPTLSAEEVGQLVDLVEQMNAQESGTQAHLDAMNAVYDFLGQRLPVTALETWTAWRKLAMLANPKTHIRNSVSNGINYAVIHQVDTLLTAGLERVFLKNIEERTTYLGWSRTEHGKSIQAEVDKATDEAVVQMKRGGGKYDIADSKLSSHKRYFGNGAFRWLNTLSDFNSTWLEKGDEWTFRPAYRNALGQIMTARGMTEATTEVKELAYRQAAEVTFRADNVLSGTINHLKAKFPKVGTAIDVVIPFTKTPANIAVQMAQHSPLGLAKASFDLMQKVRSAKNAKSTAAIINEFAKGITGTALFIIGLLLGNAGLFNTGYGKTEKERAADELAGIQENSLVIGGWSFTLDWLQPAAAPLIIGASVAQRLREDGLEFGTAFGAIMDGTDSLFELTMLQSLYDVLGGYDAGVSSSLVSIAENAVSQSIPTLLGQTARAIDPVQRKTKGDNGFETALNQVLAKIPGLTYLLEPELDVWGEEVYRTGKADAGGGWLNVLQQSLLPMNVKRATAEDEISLEILRLYEEVGSSAIPTALTRDEATDHGLDYVETNRQLGAVNRQAIEDFMLDNIAYTVQEELANGRKRNMSKQYSEMTDDERRRVLSRISRKAKEQFTSDEDEKDKDDYWTEIMRRVQDGT